MFISMSERLKPLFGGMKLLLGKDKVRMIPCESICVEM